MDFTKVFSSFIGLSVDPMTIQVLIYEDNASVLVLAETIPPELTPCSKTYHVKTVRFCEEIKRKEMKLIKIDKVLNFARVLACN